MLIRPMSSAAGQRVPTLIGGEGEDKVTVDVLSVVSKFIDEFQPLIFETVNNIVKVLKCANSFFRGLSE